VEFGGEFGYVNKAEDKCIQELNRDYSPQTPMFDQGEREQEQHRHAKTEQRVYFVGVRHAGTGSHEHLQTDTQNTARMST
jgi:hypothetical protein